MPRLLVVHHTPSPAMQALLEAVQAGAAQVEGVEVVLRPALTASPVDVLQADGLVLGTPANIGYMSGALKHFFDGVYYPCLSSTVGSPYALYVHGNDDVTGAVRGVERICTGLGWERVRPPLEVTGGLGKDVLADAEDLGGVLAARLAGWA